MSYHFLQKIIRFLSQGKVGVIPTDTIYGIVGSALNSSTVEEIYNLRKRDKSKPMIILISGISDLEKFDIKISDETKKILEKLWPQSVSIVLPCLSEKFSYLHRGKKTLAFRVPKGKWLHDLLKQVGPIVAPSANIEGDPVSVTVEDAKKYFGDNVFYVDHGKLSETPSTLVQIEDGKIKVLRQGIMPVCGQ